MAKEETEGIKGIKLLTSTTFRTWNIEINIYLESKGLKKFGTGTVTKLVVPTALQDWNDLTQPQQLEQATRRGHQVITQPPANNNNAQPRVDERTCGL